jgi:polyphosphate kinase 2 (PPK2 family)
MLNKCSKKHAPWYVIPADHKWFRNFAVSKILVDTMERMNLKYPKPAGDLSHIEFE